ncbi:peptidylprolyl isomerase [Ascidiimonas sp. W6]|uniref:peptidylprolyl isomerase n=1 Tax=Ascidiimonas meishanensis TaxID=3128903 RepID=UPI0030EE14D8
MAILEKIRQRSLVLILVIGLALFAFVISDLFRSQGFGSSKEIVGEVNGTDIKIDEFRAEVDQLSNQYGPNVSNTQVVNQVWDQQLQKALYNEQFEELGLNIEKDQIIEVVKSIPQYTSSPQFQNEAGLFDENKFIEFLAELKATDPNGFAQWQVQEQRLIQVAQQQMYFNLIKAGLGASFGEGKESYKMENDKVNVKYVQVPYASIPDSTITVSKKEIQTYIENHKSDFEEEASRSITYVLFEEKPSLEDEDKVLNSITALLEDTVEEGDTVSGFKSTKDLELFVNRYSDVRYDSSYVSKKRLPALFADSLFSLEIGDVFGPYKDAETYKISRMVAKKPNGSVKASHILIAYQGATRANPKITRTKEEAKIKAEELLAKAKLEPGTFTALARDNSDGPSAPQGGDLGYLEEGATVAPFNDFIFGNEEGAIGLVETDFGFHVIHVDDKEDQVLIATISQKLEASEETNNELFTNATKFEIAVADKDFQSTAKENNYVVRPVNKVKALDENLPGLGNQRTIVKWAFEEESKVGSVKRFNVPNGYVVAQITKKTKKGLTTPEEASSRVLPILRKQKKAAIIKEKNENVSSLDAFAKANNTQVNSATTLTMKSPTIAGAGREPKVVGAAFGLEEGKTSSLIEGENGVFMVQVTKKENSIELDNYGTYANTIKTATRNSVNSKVFTALKEAAKIEDNRSDFY